MTGRTQRCKPSRTVNDTLSSGGFSLIELLVVVAIIAIVTLIAVPAYQNFVDRQKLNAASEQLVSDLRWAKGEAIKRNVTVEVSFTPALDANWSYSIAPSGATAVRVVSGASVHPDVRLSTGAHLQAATPANVFTFDSVRGLTDPPGVKYM